MWDFSFLIFLFVFSIILISFCVHVGLVKENPPSGPKEILQHSITRSFRGRGRGTGKKKKWPSLKLARPGYWPEGSSTGWRRPRGGSNLLFDYRWTVVKELSSP